MDSPASLGYRKEKLIKNLKKYVTRLGFEPLISFFTIGYTNYLAIDQKEKLINKKLTRLGFEPPTSCLGGGPSYRLAIDMSCERKFNKHDIRQSGDSMKME